MCGRFTLIAHPEDLIRAFPGLQVGAPPPPRYNIAPSQPVAVIANDGRFALDYFVWGLIPSWAKETAIGNRLINARAETLLEKPSFRGAFRYRRCLIPASGFYEWQRQAGRTARQPMYIRLKSTPVFAFGGLWERWQGADGSEILSCTIITTPPNALVATIHDRMPLILPPEAYELWLTPGAAPLNELQALLRPYPADEMEAYPVSPLVNDPRRDEPACIRPLPDVG